MDGPDGDVLVRLESHLSADTRLLTCAALRPGHWRTWHPLSVTAPGVLTG